MPLSLRRVIEFAPKRWGAVLVMTSALSGCANLASTGLFPPRDGRAQTSAAAPTVDALDAPAPANAMTIDPLNAPPPTDAASINTGGAGSQLVPLGALNAADMTPAPKRNGPAPLIPNAPVIAAATSVPTSAPTPAPAMAVPATPMPTSAPAPAPVPVPAAKPEPIAAYPAPAVPYTGQPAPVLPQPETVAAAPVPQPAAMPDAPRRATLSEFFNRTLPSTNVDTAAPGTGVLFPVDAAQTQAVPPDAREFVPAQLSSAAPMTNAAPAAPKLTVAESNIVRRFQVLSRLLDEGLITQEEYGRRRSANIGGLLPYSKEPPGLGLDRPVPAPAAISARLQALGRALEMRAISASQHEFERGVILNSLLPERPDPRAARLPPPTDMFALADAAGRLSYLREEGLISEGEFDTERTAMDRAMRGVDPTSRSTASSSRNNANAMNGESGNGGARNAGSQRASSPGLEASLRGEKAEAAAEKAPETLQGPVLHLASFRSTEGARSGFEQAKAKNPKLFENLRFEARRANVPGQGTFYRLLVGPFASMLEAESACVEMKKADQFCRPTPDGN
jgi:cell division septation protein DedD